MVRIAELNRKKVDVNVYLQSTWSSLSSFSPSPPPFPSPHYWQQQKQLEIFADIAAAWLAHAHVIFDFRLFRATPSLFALFRFQTARQSCSFSLSSVSILLCPSVSLSPCLSVCLSVCLCQSVSVLPGRWSVDFWQLSERIQRCCRRIVTSEWWTNYCIGHLGSFVVLSSETFRYVALRLTASITW